MTDIVSLLRVGGKIHDDDVNFVMNQAADEIENLRKERDKLDRKNELMEQMVDDMIAAVTKTRAALGEKD